MEINGLSQSTGITTPTVNVEKPATNISADFETFLKMLTVQMQNQDPLNPIDSSDYAVQLATFSGVEQQVQTNDLLKGLAASLGAAGLSEMAGWVGMEARTAAPAYYGGSALTVVPRPSPNATTSELLVRDSNGIEVDRLPIAVSDEPISWTGTTADGITLPSGQYSFETINYVDGQIADQTPSEVYGRVVEVQSGQSGAVLIMQGGAAVDASDVTALRDS